MRKLAAGTGQAHQREHLLDPCRAFAAAHGMQPEGDVVRHAQVREQGVVLEHHADAPVLGRHGKPRRRHHLPLQQDAAFAQRLEAGDGAQHRGLAAAAGAKQAGDAAAREGEGQVVDNALAAEAMVDAIDLDHDVGSCWHG